MKEDIYKKINASHSGWIEHSESQRKTHYYIKEDGDWYISICGEILANRDLLNRFEENYQCKDSVNNYCKHCLIKNKKLILDGHVTTKLKGILVT